ncbi:hypothetical protein EXU57_06870 [Segetibacter sp. 3557_3]|nr:hypothetical protein EXU57_06870 [Segetibacter sp. 3557_3]
MLSAAAISQNQTAGSQQYKTIPAGKEYQTSRFHQWLWGTNYRKEWSTPVRLPVAMLDTLGGGLTPVKAGGGNQTKSLQVVTRDKKTYTIRSVNKTLGKVLPEEFLGTFIEDLVDDKVSMSHPYASAAASHLAGKANLFHTNPSFVYMPKQKAIDTFRQFGNEVYLFEQKLSGDWKGAANLGNFGDFIGTDDLLEKMFADNNIRINQLSFIKHRLFDMLINDWDRHEKQWEWGTRDESKVKVYYNVPQDRDQAFFKYNGVLLSTLIKASGLSYFQPFKPIMEDVKSFNYEERNLDRFFTNSVGLEGWEQMAAEIEKAITDKEIAIALAQMPKEIQGMSNQELTEALQGRRSKLVKYAAEYYRFIAKEVDVVGSKSNEHFEVTVPNEEEMVVKIYATGENNLRQNAPYYQRTFKASETREVRIFGLGGNDIFDVKGTSASPINLRIIGGEDRDSVTTTGEARVHIYDNKDNSFNTGSATKYHLASDSAVHAFKYANYTYSKKGISPVVFYTNEDRLFVGVAYNVLKQKWRKSPFAYKHNVSLNYSISQLALSLIYKGVYPSAIGKWDLNLSGIYDAVRWTNYFGMGNDSKFVVDDIDYYRARTEEWLAAVGLKRKIGRSTIQFNGLFQQVRIINDTGRYTGKNLNPGTMVFRPKQFAGAEAQYNLYDLNDPVVPTRGFGLMARASFLQNLKDAERSVANFQAHSQVYLPLIPKFSLSLRAGAETITGKPEFYQYAAVGGGQQLRGFRQTRFWGKTAFYNSNELRFINNVKSYIYNGKLGLVGFLDNGRVWLPGEQSDTWHVGYGAGVLLAPFNKILAEVTYGLSKDENLIQLRLTVPVR